MTAISPAPDKPTLRRQFLQARQALSQKVWQDQSAQLCAHLRASSLFLQARTVLAYFSIRQEPDLMPLVQAGFHKTWGFPRCQETQLIWHVWQWGDPRTAGPYGIQEPSQQLPVLKADQVDLLLVPALACDLKGYRLGYGGGFYDRLLSTPAWQQKPTVGIVFESARLPLLPRDPWDRPLQAVCTEAGFFKIQEDKLA